MQIKVTRKINKSTSRITEDEFKKGLFNINKELVRVGFNIAYNLTPVWSGASAGAYLALKDIGIDVGSVSEIKSKIIATRPYTSKNKNTPPFDRIMAGKNSAKVEIIDNGNGKVIWRLTPGFQHSIDLETEDYSPPGPFPPFGPLVKTWTGQALRAPFNAHKSANKVVRAIAEDPNGPVQQKKKELFRRFVGK